jgi:hypothetical protein
MLGGLLPRLAGFWAKIAGRGMQMWLRQREFPVDGLAAGRGLRRVCAVVARAGRSFSRFRGLIPGLLIFTNGILTIAVYRGKNSQSR